MTRRKMLPILAVVLLLAVATRLAAAADKEEEALRGLVPKILAAWGTMDWSKIEPYYASDVDFMYFDIMPLKYNNWKEYREGAQKLLFDPNTSITAMPKDDLKVHQRGSLAWATFTFSADLVSKGGTTSHIEGRWTMVLEKRAKGWTVVHEHVSVPLPSS